MIELRVQCDCGQKYKFEVEPVNGRVPYPIACPACGTELPARKVPWHIKVLVFATVVYLGYRGYQGVTWIIHHA